jgi:regulator of ribonuclease activity A
MTIVTADLHDANEGRVAVCELQFRGFGRRPAFAGPCVTLKVHEDHRRVKEVLASPGQGRVLVVDGGGSLRVAVMGDILARMAAENGWAGVVVNGAIRDAAVIDGLEIGVKALGTVPRRGSVETGGAVDVPVSFGGVAFRPGDWVYADADGVLVGASRLIEP